MVFKLSSLAPGGYPFRAG